VIPWIERKNFQPIFKHRPSNCVKINIKELSDRLKLSYSKVEINDLNRFFSEKAFRHILIAGAGLLPKEVAMNHKIINSHPGYLPNVKGLDAFKWAIYQGQPIGVTTHYISDKVDEGVLIERRIIPIYFEDSFHSVAYRIYETEIEMLVNSIKLIDNNQLKYESLADNRYIPNKRMPHNLELIMISRFEEIRKKSPSYLNE
jgi:phosphoribosylglycinamide formyltransferase-1